MLARHRLRWLNGAGFALTLFFAGWLVAFLMSLMSERFEDVRLPMPTPFAVVAGLSLIASVVLLCIVLFGHLLRGADMEHWKARMLLFAWTCTSALFCLTQTVVLMRSGARGFPHVADWFSSLYWYFCAVGAVVFLLLLWVNSEPHDTWQEDDDEA